MKQSISQAINTFIYNVHKVKNRIKKNP